MRSKKIYPQFLPVSDSETLSLASSLIDKFKESIGHSYIKLEESCSSINYDKPIIFSGLKKILMDACNTSELDKAESISEKRWALILSAQNLRKEQLFTDISSEILSGLFEQLFTGNFSKLSK